MPFWMYWRQFVTYIYETKLHNPTFVQGQFQPILFYFGPVVSEKNAFNIDFFQIHKNIYI